nr:outer membrane beta-barrel protein [Hymenobacter defluvii]
MSGYATTSYGQRLTAAGISGSFNIARLHTGQGAFQLGNVTVDPQFDQSNDETGNGITVFGRWQLGARPGWYVQPELGYVSTLTTPVGLTYSSGSGPYFGPRARHLDARLLGGYQAGPLRLFAGPTVGYFLHSKDYGTFSSQDAELQTALATLRESGPKRVQAAVQAGVGVNIWRFDLNARYEWGLSRYSRLYDTQLKTNYFTRKQQQLILEVGFRIFNNPTAE